MMSQRSAVRRETESLNSDLVQKYERNAALAPDDDEDGWR